MNSIKITEREKHIKKQSHQEYLESAKEFARQALEANKSPVIIQNAHKAVEFALSVYAPKKDLAVPRDHWQSKNLAYKIDKQFGKNFGELLGFYLGAYRLENGNRAKRALSLMKAMLEELEKHVEEAILPK